MSQQIKRLISRNGSAMYVHENGSYVSYADHAATVTQLQQQIADLTAERVAIAKAALEVAAKVCERRAEDRFSDHGTREGDTGAAYYQGTHGDEYGIRDEEDDDCAAYIRRIDPATIVASVEGEL